MAKITWILGPGAFQSWTTAADWSTGTVPGSGDDAIVPTGGPLVFAPIAVHSLVTGHSGGVFFSNAGASTVSGEVRNGGTISLDTNQGDGGSTLTVGGTLINSGFVRLGDASNSPPSMITAASLDNTGGTIVIDGHSTLSIAAAAGFGSLGVLQGNVQVSSNALLEFVSGQITTIADSSSLLIQANSRVADAGDTTTNSALVGLRSILGGFTLDAGATLGTSGMLSNAGGLTLSNGGLLTTGGALRNSGALRVGVDFTGGSQLTIGGALVNSGTVSVGSFPPLNYFSPSPSTIVATGLNNTGGEIDLTGREFGQATLDVAAAAGFGKTGLLIGTVSLSGKALVEFSSGQITSIAQGASLALAGDARIADASDTTTNSALTGLVGNAGTFRIAAAQVTTTTAFSNSGAVEVDGFGYFYSGGLFAVGGKLTNSGTLGLYGHSYDGGSAEVDAATLSNTGTINLTGYFSNGATTNANALAKLAVAGVTGGTGSIRLAGSALVELGGSVVATQTIDFAPPLDSLDAGGSTLVLGAPGRFAGAVTGFGANDTLDLAGEIVTGLAYAGSILTVTLAGGAKQTFKLSGTFGNLHTADDGSGGTDIVGDGNRRTLTTASDTVNFIQGANTVDATAATLNPADSLTGGTGIDTLALTGGGTFDLTKLAKFTGFERVTLDNATSVLKLRADAAIAAIGGRGSDKYYVANAGDLVSDSGGKDQVLASVTYALQAGQAIERLSTANSSGTGAINLTGNELANAIIGNAGANVLNGRAGNDTLIGRGGHDTFVFSTALDAAANVDTVTDFTPTAGNPTHDMIALAGAIFAAAGPAGGLAASAFHVGTGASGASQRIIYDGATGGLFYDADGNGAAAQIQFAKLTPGLAMTNADFKIV